MAIFSLSYLFCYFFSLWYFGLTQTFGQTHDDNKNKICALQLISEKEEQLKRINTLVLKEDKVTSDIPTSEEIKRSDLYLELTTKLATTTRKLEELDDKTTLIKKEWSTALADAKLSKKALEGMQTNYFK